MKREIIITSDGSTTIRINDWNEQYHSKHGAIQEAKHVFIKNGLNFVSENEISILEIGFGTGLNCLITFLESDKKINYVAVEAYPVSQTEIKKLNYTSKIQLDNSSYVFDKIHSASWNKKHKITLEKFLTKKKMLFEDINYKNCFNIIYFDAFGARVQPELWTEAIFGKMYKALKVNGILVTYSAKGSVRRAMQSVGFFVEKLKGPPGKREMLRGIKKEKKEDFLKMV